MNKTIKKNETKCFFANIGNSYVYNMNIQFKRLFVALLAFTTLLKAANIGEGLADSEISNTEVKVKTLDTRLIHSQEIKSPREQYEVSKTQLHDDLDKIKKWINLVQQMPSILNNFDEDCIQFKHDLGVIRSSLVNISNSLFEHETAILAENDFMDLYDVVCLVSDSIGTQAVHDSHRRITLQLQGLGGGKGDGILACINNIFNAFTMISDSCLQKLRAEFGEASEGSKFKEIPAERIDEYNAWRSKTNDALYAAEKKAHEKKGKNTFGNMIFANNAATDVHP